MLTIYACDILMVRKSNSLLGVFKFYIDRYCTSLVEKSLRNPAGKSLNNIWIRLLHGPTRLWTV